MMFSGFFQILEGKRVKDKIKQSVGSDHSEIGADIRPVESSETESLGKGPQGKG